MKRIFWVHAFILLMSTQYVLAEAKTDEWQNSILSETTIKKVQEAKLGYRKCIGENMQKPVYLDMDSRKATDEITKQCEPMLAKMRDVYASEKVPAEIADRHLRQVRIQTMRKLLEEMIFAHAARQSAKP